ncbi:RTA-like protein [Penicillium cf. griseofulvum]|uniref:RTA-like protein n=1 Tax=Penicillium cf. griseofulvum TaxID=2972120 RepID=A0A9W9M4A1_9EURO|nr:RTA-like protein [Penicillium cf. griseofulvum]KAJ5452237.1 RTA-like protein [Penicillium cf. griseofulvum]
MTDITQLQTGCPAYTESVGTSYGYVPSLGAGIAYCVLFGLSMILHTIQFAWKRQWWASVFSIGCLVELIGWAGRTWSAKCPYNSTAFLMQIATLVIAPTFFTAGIYILLGRFIQLLGPESSIIKPKLYLWIFCTCDIVSLVIQAVGGGMASGEAGVVGGDTATGTHIMVAGIVFQLVSITIFIFCAVDFVRRVIRKSLLQSVTGSVIPLFVAMILSIVCMYIRSIYRTIELSQGWDGYLITHESYFIGLDGAMMIVSVGVFNVLHPGWMLPSGRSESYKMEMGSIDGSDN